jgi:hypothetical protein
MEGLGTTHRYTTALTQGHSIRKRDLPQASGRDHQLGMSCGFPSDELSAGIEWYKSGGWNSNHLVAKTPQTANKHT